MQKLGVSVWIHPSFATIRERVGRPGRRDRPLFENENQALELYRKRLEAYRAADFEIDVESREDAASVAARIVMRLREENCDI